MRAAARRVARAIKRGAREEREANAPRQYRATILVFNDEDDFSVDLHGEDLTLDEEDVTLGQTVRRYNAEVGLEADDALILNELGEGDYVAVDVESSNPETGAP